MGPHQQAGRDHPERRAAQGRLLDLQQAASQPEPARSPADDDLVGGDAGDVRAAQEAEVARRRVPAQAPRGERVRVQGRRAGRAREAGDDEIHELDADSDIVLAEDDEDVIVDSGGRRRGADAADGRRRGRGADDTVGAAGAGRRAGAVRGREVRSRDPGGVRRAGGGSAGEGSSQSNDMVDLRNLWSDDDLPPNLGWEQTPGQGRRRGAMPVTRDLATVTARARRWGPR